MAESDEHCERRRAVLSTNNQTSRFLVLVAFSHSVFFPQMHACISKEMDVRSSGERGIVFWCFCFAGGCASTMVSRPRNRKKEGKKGMQEKKRDREKGEAPGKMSTAARRGKRDNDEAATTVGFRQASGGTGRKLASTCRPPPAASARAAAAYSARWKEKTCQIVTIQRKRTRRKT